MANRTGDTFPSTGLFDMARLIGALGYGLFRHPLSVNPGLLLSNWIWGVTRRHKSENIVVNLGIRRILLVTGKDLSKHILDERPSAKTYLAGRTKTQGMSFLAPQGLTICHDEQWQGLRTLNEQVLAVGADPALEQAVLDQVHQAFSGPVSKAADLRENMGKVMLGVVFGGAPAHLVEDIQVLFGYVQCPLKRLLLGRRQRGRRERFYSTIRQMWEKNEQPQSPNLVGTACPLAQGGDFDMEELVQQVPHWMFTFTGSGTDLLTRTLAMLGSRPDAGRKVREEIAAAEWSRFSDDMSWYTVTGKLDKTATLPVHQMLRDELADGGTGFVFPGRFGGHVSPATIWDWTKRVAAEVGLHNFSTHQLRHTALTTANDSLGDLRAVQTFARHKRPETTAGYTRTKQTRLREVSDSLDYL